MLPFPADVMLLFWLKIELKPDTLHNTFLFGNARASALFVDSFIISSLCRQVNTLVKSATWGCQRGFSVRTGRSNILVLALVQQELYFWSDLSAVLFMSSVSCPPSNLLFGSFGFWLSAINKSHSQNFICAENRIEKGCFIRVECVFAASFSHLGCVSFPFVWLCWTMLCALSVNLPWGVFMAGSSFKRISPCWRRYWPIALLWKKCK